MKQEYVVGLLFDPHRKYICLIQKNRPDFQRGFLNGVGGKIENGEWPLQAMIRGNRCGDCRLVSLSDDWGTNSTIYYYRAFSQKIYSVRSITDEVVGVYSLHNLPDNLFHHLSWTIPLALSGVLYTEASF